MKLTVLGTGIVGRTIAARLAANGHKVALGTRDPKVTLGRMPAEGQQSLADWLKANPGITLMTFHEAAMFGEWVFCALSGKGVLDGIVATGADAIRDKILVDISNPLDFSHGMPPSLFVSNTNSLGEMIQRLVPRARVVKTLNMVNAAVMVEPGEVAGGNHTMFVCGNDSHARIEVANFLKTEFGWKDVMDLGDLTAARGMESALHLWLKLWGVIGHGSFGIKVAR